MEQHPFDETSEGIESVLKDERVGELERRLATAESDVKQLASRLVDSEHQGGRLMNLYVATYQLHATLDPAEVQFGFTAPAMFHDVETGRELYVDPEAARQEYLARFAAHAAEIERACVDLDIEYKPITTDRPMVRDALRHSPARMATYSKPLSPPTVIWPKMATPNQSSLGICQGTGV